MSACGNEESTKLYLVLPILGHDSGYGWTYGARFTHPEPAGRDSRLSIPATWGAQKRIGAELEKRFSDGWITRLEAYVV